MMIRRSLSLFTRRFLTALALGSVAVPASTLAASPDPVVAPAVAAPAKKAPVVTAQAIAIGVDKRNPIGEGSAFDTKVGALYAWVKVKNLGEPTTITMVWKKEGKKKLSATLPVGHAWGWKTWSKKGIAAKDAGAWTVEVLSADGQLLQTLAFDVAGNGSEVGSN